MIKTFFLVLTMAGGAVVIPKDYPNEQLCNDAGQSFKSFLGARFYYCVPHWSEPK